MTSPAAGPSRRTLLLCFHNHQPVGNFDFVLEEAASRSYLPFLTTLARYPGIKVTLHYTGYLLRWLAERRRDVVDLLKELVARGQAEILGGGMYEPVLALVPERDRIGQIRALSEMIAARFGAAPRGMWLAERVWEPGMASSIAAAGIEYLPVDDYHFVRAGLYTDELDGVFLTEDNGAALRVFPGSELLRYKIPFAPVDDTMRAVEQMTARDVPYPAAIFADDGEKFGVWPGTYKSVYEEGWLDRFFEAIEARRDSLATMTFGEYVSAAPVRGRIYLPTCSYIEMGEWALPSAKAARFGRMLHDFRAGRSPETKPFVQGGYFRNFLRKYEESNQLHKRMLGVSGRVEEASRAGDAAEARDLLYRAQCNDVYWHGVFGGLYLNHLREAAYGNLLRAEAAAERILRGGAEGWTEAARGDIDRDGDDEILIRTGSLVLFVHPHDGGAVTEISLPRRGVALGHVLTRREEGYHETFRTAGDAREGAASIHDVLVLKDPSVLQALGADPCQRASFREAIFRREDAPDAILSGSAAPIGNTAGREARARVEGGDSRVVLVQELPLEGAGASLTLEKTLEAGADEAFRAAYRIANAGREPFAGTFASEWNLNFLSGNKPDRRYEGVGEDDALSSRALTPALREFRIVDAWRRIAVAVKADAEFTLLRYPIETASLSEAGAERIHQGICLRLLFPVSLGIGEAGSISLTWAIGPALPNGPAGS